MLIILGVLAALTCGCFGYCFYAFSRESRPLYPQPNVRDTPPQTHKAPQKTTVKKYIDDANGNDQ